MKVNEVRRAKESSYRRTYEFYEAKSNVAVYSPTFSCSNLVVDLSIPTLFLSQPPQ